MTRQPPEQSFSAKILVDGGETIDAELHYSSKYSLYVLFDNRTLVPHNSEFLGVLFRLNKVEYKLAACRFLLDYDDERFSGRLVFVTELYDFDRLFYNGELIDLGKLSNDLEVMRSQKEDIHESFQKYVSDLTYDLQVYRALYSVIDKQIDREQASIASIVSETFLRLESAKFNAFMHSSLEELARVISKFSRNEHIRHGYYFRKQVWDFILESEFMARTNLKPRGYIGDSEMMRMIYELGYRGRSTFARILYRFSLDHPAAQAVRNRRSLIAEAIKQHCERSTRDEVHIMSVACGPAYELLTFFQQYSPKKSIRFTFLDQDEAALDEARQTIKEIERIIGFRLSVEYVQDSIRTFIRSRSLEENPRSYDLIYSMGLFDYLTDLVGKRVLRGLCQMLQDNGQIIIGNYHYDNPSRWFMEYWHDWVLYYRDEDEVRALVEELDVKDISVQFEDSGCQMFLSAWKDTPIRELKND